MNLLNMSLNNVIFLRPPPKLKGSKNKKDTERKSAKEKSHADFDKRVKDAFIEHEKKKLFDTFEAKKYGIQEEIATLNDQYEKELQEYKEKTISELERAKEQQKQQIKRQVDSISTASVKSTYEKELDNGYGYRGMRTVQDILFPYTDVSTG